MLYGRGIQLPPPQSKLESVSLPRSAIKIKAGASPAFVCKGKRWIDISVSDLARLSRESEPERFQFRLYGPMIAGCVPIIAANNNYNKLAALLCRVFRGVPPAQKGIWRWASQFKPHIFPMYTLPPPEMSFDDWLSSMPPRRRRPLFEAFKLYRDSGWSDKYSTFNAFIKEEFLPGFQKQQHDILALSELVSRLINAPHEVTHVIAGRKETMDI